MIATTDITSFNKLVNEKLAQGYKFITGQPVYITDHEDSRGRGYQYSVALLLEEIEESDHVGQA